jgi:organic hydroperoxide reductase OsmC/OhrA
VSGDGVVGKRDDDTFGFTRMRFLVAIKTDAGQEELARELVPKAEEDCLVAVSLDLPVELDVKVEAAPN